MAEIEPAAVELIGDRGGAGDPSFPAPGGPLVTIA